MVGRHRNSVSEIEKLRPRPRWGSLVRERTLLDLLDPDIRLEPTNLTLAPINSNIYARRHSAHSYPVTEEKHSPPQPLPPPVPLRPPAVPKRNYIPPSVKSIEQLKPPQSNEKQSRQTQQRYEPPPPPPPLQPQRKQQPQTQQQQSKQNPMQQQQQQQKPANIPTVRSVQPPPIPPASKNRALPPIPTEYKPHPPIRKQVTVDLSNNVITRQSFDVNRNGPAKATPKTSSSNNAFQFNNIPQSIARCDQSSNIPKSPTPPTPKPTYSSNVSAVKSPVNPQGRVSVRQDSGVSSDSFSQTSSPSYTTKTMETPLLPPRTPIKQHNGLLSKVQNVILEDDANGNNTITKSASTPASLQTIVKFHDGSNMSLHHRIIRDIRRPSRQYTRRMRLSFRFAQIVLNAIALFAIGAGMIAYFKAYPNTAIHIVNQTTNATVSPIVIEKMEANPAPGICLPVIVNFCQQHKVPYNFTVFPNYMGQFGQRDAQSELEVYDAVVDVRCYELAALFLCSLFVPKCGPTGVVVRPCRSICQETKRRCGFFLEVFGLVLPDYLQCDLFPENADPEVCVGHSEFKQAIERARKPVCPTGFRCDNKRCIPRDWQCDGHVDCKDQTDELNCNKCAPGMVHCGADRCITQEHMCDGKVDCPWGQDERNCLRLSERNGDEGKGQLEVYRPDQEKWVPACVAHWDQKTSAKSICSLLGYSNTNGSRLLSGTDKKISSPIQDTTALWRMNQNKRPKNLIREFGSCNGTNYPTVDLVCTDYICGKARKSYAERRSMRIVGGVRSKPGDWPFLAALLGGPEEIFYCAGVLIADQWVLTASHCVGNHSDVSGWTIQLGITRRHAHSFYGQKMKVKRVVPHPMYNLGVAHDNDVALFQLSESVTFHEHLLPVCLPPPNKELHPGTVCTVIGWGKKEDTGMSEYEPEVNEVEVPVLNRDLCNAWLEHRDLNVTDGMICAGYKEGGKDACQGDSGGPLLCRDEKDPDRWFVGGIVSWGIKCAHPHLPGVYAYVPKYIPWINEQIKLLSD